MCLSGKPILVETTMNSQKTHEWLCVQDGLDAKVLAEELLALESQFRTSTMNPMGGTKMAGDWTVTIDGGSGRCVTLHSCKHLGSCLAGTSPGCLCAGISLFSSACLSAWSVQSGGLPL